MKIRQRVNKGIGWALSGVGVGGIVCGGWVAYFHPWIMVPLVFSGFGGLLLVTGAIG